MKIIILTQYYPPEHGAPQNRLHDLAKRLLAAGDEVTVMTAMPNYPRGEVFPEYRGRFSMKEEIDGVKVVRSWIFASKSKGKIPQLTSYFSFVFSALFAGVFRLPRADLLICESPPLFLGFTALLLKSAKSAKLVFNVSDLWPESAVQLGMIGPGMALSLLEWFEKLLYRSSAFVSCQTEGIVKGVETAEPKASTLLFPNGVDLEMFPKIKRPRGKRGKRAFIVGYGGNHGRSQALGRVLEAAAIVAEKNPDIEFRLVGDGPEKSALLEQAEKDGLKNVVFLPPTPREKMGETMAEWNCALVPLRDIPLFNGARPSKMFELMASGIPFVFSGRGEGAEIAEKSGCAVVAPPEKPAELAEAILDLAAATAAERKKMGDKGRKFVEKNFNRAEIAEDFRKKVSSVFNKGERQ
jgi:glycosyltransferase involved in cell wall biosynthesis